MNSDHALNIRLATLDDKDFIVSLTPRLVEFTPPVWREATQLIAQDIAVLVDALDNPLPDSAIYVAEDSDGRSVGFVHLRTVVDYYTQQKHGHVADLVVSPTSAGQGIGQALMRQAEEWARRQQYTWLTLNVFAQNRRAIKLYERIGYGPDILKYVKALT